MTMLEGLSQPQRDALNAIRADGETTFKANASTIKALIDRGLIEVAPVDQPQRWILSPVGEMMYFADEVMSQYTTANFEVGQDVEYLHWHTNQFPMRFEWEAGYVQRITKAFVFVKYPNGEVKQHMPKRLRRKPLTQREHELDAIIIDSDFHLVEQPDPYERFTVGDRAVRKADNAEIVISAVDGDYISGSGTRYCEKTVGMIRSGNGTYIKAKDYVHVPVTVTRAHRKHFMRPVTSESRPVVELAEAVQSAGQALGLASAGFNAFDVPGSVLVEASRMMAGPLTSLEANQVADVVEHAFATGQLAITYSNEQATDTSFEPYIPEPRTEGDRIIVTGFCSVCGCQYDESWPNTMNRERWWRWTNMISRCSVCFHNNCYECGKPLPATDAERSMGYCAECSKEDTSFELLVREPRMVNERLIAVTAFCKACSGQYDDISFFEVDNPWKRSQLVDYCPICLQFTCMWCGKELPAPAIEPYCAACNAGPMQVNKAKDALPASVCAEFSLLAMFLDGGEGAYHALWTWYMQQISIGLIAYEGADPLQAKLYERALRSASSLLHTRFEEEYFSLVVEVGTGRPEVDLLYHKLPISVETTVRDWLYTWGGFDYVAQMTDIRQVAREHAVYVDPIKPTLTAAEYREGQYGHRQRAGVCRVWYAHNRVNHLVEYVTSDNHVHLRGVETPIPATDTLDVEELEPVHVNDRVQRIDNALIGTVVGVSGGDLWVKPENGDQQPRWKRIHVNVIGGDPSDAPTDEYDRALNEAVLETMGGAQDAAPQPEDPIAYACAQIRLHLQGGMRVGAIQSVTHVEDQYYRVVFTHFSEYVPDELFERVRFVYDAIRDGDPTTCCITVDLANPPFWRVRQSDEAREFQAVLDAAGIALEARYNAQNELFVHHPLEDVLERLCANVRKLAGVLAVDLGFNDNPCLAQVTREEVVARG